MKREVGMVAAGILVETMIATPAAGAVSDLLTVQRVSYPVYVDGTWYAVNLTNYDSSYTRGTPGTLLTDPSTLQRNPYRQIEPELTRFAKEVLVPGSTK